MEDEVIPDIYIKPRKPKCGFCGEAEATSMWIGKTVNGKFLCPKQIWTCTSCESKQEHYGLYAS